MISRFFRSAVSSAAILLCVIVLPKAVQADPSEIRIAGGSTALGSFRQLAAAFRQLHPGIHFHIFPEVGSAGGLKATAQGAADIGLMGRPLEGKELTMGMSSIEYARTPLAFIGGPKVNVSGLTLEEIIRIYRGETTQWPDGEYIRLILYSASDIDTALEKKISPDLSFAIDMALSRPGMVIASSTQDGYDKVKAIPGSLGFCALTKVLTEQGSVKILAFNGVLPSVKNLQNGSYPLFKPLYLVFKSRPSAAITDFLKFVQSPEGMQILEKAGDMPVAGIYRSE